ncbi:hypothetical protein AVEN_116124-1 [Araneus ventricosus]|uniref:Peptidase A2 domain-containing protein n=1 Tax=Araneus ventricosus TaxID=182803 RepID=A0A4Y2K1X1_ARAVE|nr:hypothetical protein AVEN_257823-1 [Araneus ventricosus]GBM95808.1 hypothetical protein AVEN_116124-1 [Araneus ventricosus]
MAFLYKAKKTYLRAVAEELGIEVTEKMIKPQIIKAIMASEHFEEQLVSNMLEEEEAPENTWTDFAYEVKNYFQGWIRGLNVKTFEELSNVIITEQIKKKVSAEIYDHFLDEWSQLKIPEKFANKLDDFENVRADRKMETSWRDQPGERFTYDCKEQRNTADCKFCSSPVKEEKYRAPRREQYSTRINMRKDCYVCGLSHLARDCPERYQVSTPNKKLNRHNDVPTAEIQSYRLKPEKSSHLPANISINSLQYVTTVVGEKEVKTLIDSGAQIPVINGKFLSQGKITTAIQRTNGELSVSQNGGFGELKKEIERLREDLERLRRQIKPSENEAVSTDKGSEDIESEQPEHCITVNPLKATVYGLADSENKDGHSNTYISDDELSNDEIIDKLTPAWMQSSSTSLLGLTMEGSRNISGSNCMTVSKI